MHGLLQATAALCCVSIRSASLCRAERGRRWRWPDGGGGGRGRRPGLDAAQLSAAQARLQTVAGCIAATMYLVGLILKLDIGRAPLLEAAHAVSQLLVLLVPLVVVPLALPQFFARYQVALVFMTRLVFFGRPHLRDYDAYPSIAQVGGLSACPTPGSAPHLCTAALQPAAAAAGSKVEATWRGPTPPSPAGRRLREACMGGACEGRVAADAGWVPKPLSTCCCTRALTEQR